MAQECPFYGMSAIAYLTPEAGFGRLIPSHGNQCALMLDSHSPCAMEMAGQDPDAKTCPLIKEVQLTARLIQEYTTMEAE